MFISLEEKDQPIEQLTVAHEAVSSILCIENQNFSNEINFLKDENARLKEALKMLEQQHFGKHGDVASDSLESAQLTENQSISHDALKEASIEATAAEKAHQTISLGAHTRKTKNKKCGDLADLSSLPRHTIHHDLCVSAVGSGLKPVMDAFWEVLLVNRKQKNITGFSCMTHACRKLSDVIKISNDNNRIAAKMIKRLQPLYDLEAMMPHHRIPVRSQKRFRQQHAKPLLIAIHQWPYLINYVNHGMAKIDINGVEPHIRLMAIGRKNGLFMKNEETGKVHSTFYSLILSATLNGINPRFYLHYLMTKMQDIRGGLLDPATLLSHFIKTCVLKTFHDQLIAEDKVILNNSR